jgi:protein phosphatase
VFSASITALTTPHDDARPQRLTYAGRTDPGRRRSENQDRFALLPDAGLVVVADGMGGTTAGDVAARMAVELVCGAYIDVNTTWPGGTTEAGLHGLPRLEAAVQHANRRIHRAAQRRAEWYGMGTTIAAVLALGSRMALVHVGDSRVYRLRQGRLERVTEDHSLFSDLVRVGAADPEHPEPGVPRHVLTRSLGMAPTVKAECRLIDALPGDTFLVCSDGLWSVVRSREIAAILLSHPDLDEATARLVERANELGGPDNITTVLIGVGSPEPSRWRRDAA